MSLQMFLQFAVILIALGISARVGGIGLGLWGGVGLLALTALGAVATAPAD